MKLTKEQQQEFIEELKTGKATLGDLGTVSYKISEEMVHKKKTDTSEKGTRYRFGFASSPLLKFMLK